ncbi:MAG: DUF3034 family protein, partial [Gammaproteobacteria bacterium]
MIIKNILSLFIFLVTMTSVYAAPPFMNFEGVGGGGIVPGAYRVNAPEADQIFGKPAISNWDAIGFNESKNNIYTNGITMSFLDHFEIGYVHEINDFRRLRGNLIAAGGNAFDVGEDTIFLHNFHFKTLISNETQYLPAFAITAEFKYNETIDKMNENIGKALDTVGYKDDFGIDLDFSISKTNIDLLGFPVVFHGNARLTRAHYLGLLGFSEDYTINAEASIAFLPLPYFGFGAEIRQQNDQFDALPFNGFSMDEDAFWDVFVTW